MSRNTGSPHSSQANSPRNPMLSPEELSQILLHPDFPHQIAATFDDEPVVTVALRYFSFISYQANELERLLEIHRSEQERLFTDLMVHSRFRRDINPFVIEHRRTRYHPYRRTPSPVSTPSNDDSISPPTSPPDDPSPTREIPVLQPPSPANSLASYVTAAEVPGSSPENPIDVDHLEIHTDVTIDRNEHWDTPIPEVGILERRPNQAPSLHCYYCGSREIHVTGECRRRPPRSDDSLWKAMGRNRHWAQ
jgi:hypothetical protein